MSLLCNNPSAVDNRKVLEVSIKINPCTLACSWTFFRNSISSSNVCLLFSASRCANVSLFRSWKNKLCIVDFATHVDFAIDYIKCAISQRYMAPISITVPSSYIYIIRDKLMYYLAAWKFPSFDAVNAHICSCFLTVRIYNVDNTFWICEL